MRALPAARLSCKAARDPRLAHRPHGPAHGCVSGPARLACALRTRRRACVPHARHEKRCTKRWSSETCCVQKNTCSFHTFHQNERSSSAVHPTRARRIAGAPLPSMRAHMASVRIPAPSSAPRVAQAGLGAEPPAPSPTAPSPRVLAAAGVRAPLRKQRCLALRPQRLFSEIFNGKQGLQVNFSVVFFRSLTTVKKCTTLWYSNPKNLSFSQRVFFQQREKKNKFYPPGLSKMTVTAAHDDGQNGPAGPAGRVRCAACAPSCVTVDHRSRWLLSMPGDCNNLWHHRKKAGSIRREAGSRASAAAQASDDDDQ